MELAGDYDGENSIGNLRTCFQGKQGSFLTGIYDVGHLEQTQLGPLQGGGLPAATHQLGVQGVTS